MKKRDRFNDIRHRLSKIQGQLMKCIADIESIKLLLYSDIGDIDDNKIDEMYV
jgi:hypothetical protein